MVKWLVRVNASMAERISGISNNPADDLAFAFEKKVPFNGDKDPAVMKTSLSVSTVQFGGALKK